MFEPMTNSPALDDDLKISRMARALSPYRSIDIKGFAKLVLLASGFDQRDIDNFWSRAVSFEKCRRMAFAERTA